MAHPGIPQFGTRPPDREAVARPSAYAILRDAGGRIAVVRTPEGVFLPGGGLEADESPDQAVVREVAEECGLVVTVQRRLGTADQWLFSQAESVHYEIRSTFFEGHIVGPTPAVEPDTILDWLAPEAAARDLTRESHRWAVTGCAVP